MQVSGILKPKRRVLLQNTTLNEAYKGFEMEVDGKVTLLMEEGALRDDIERGDGIGFVLQLTPSGTLQLKLIPYADSLDAKELEKRAQERDKREMEQRKEQRKREQEERERYTEEQLRDNARMARSQELADEQQKTLEAKNRASNTTVPNGITPSEEEVDKKVAELKKEQASGTKSASKDVAARISPVLAELGSGGKPFSTKERAKSTTTKRPAARSVKKGTKAKLKKLKGKVTGTSSSPTQQ